MSRRKYNPKLNSMQRQVQPISQLIAEGTVLSIDPSVSSHSSVPGYALFDAGILIDCGTLNVDRNLPLNQKLQAIRRTLQTEFRPPDVLAIENVPTFRREANGRTTLFNKAVQSLQWACATIVCSVDTPHLVQVAPMSWRRYIPEHYNKTDVLDAIMIGYTAILTANDFLGRPYCEVMQLITSEFRVRLTQEVIGG